MLLLVKSSLGPATSRHRGSAYLFAGLFGGGSQFQLALADASCATSTRAGRRRRRDGGGQPRLQDGLDAVRRQALGRQLSLELYTVGILQGAELRAEGERKLASVGRGRSRSAVGGGVPCSDQPPAGIADSAYLSAGLSAGSSAGRVQRQLSQPRRGVHRPRKRSSHDRLRPCPRMSSFQTSTASSDWARALRLRRSGDRGTGNFL